VVAGPLVRNAVRVPARRPGEPEAQPLLPGCRVSPLEARTLPPKRGAELLRAEARRLRIAQQLRRGRELSEVAEKLGVSGTLAAGVWIEVVKELRRTEQGGGQSQLLDEKQQTLAGDRAKLQAVADRFHAGWTLAGVARDVGLTRRLVVFGLSIILGRLRRRIRQYAAVAAMRLEDSIRQQQRVLWDAWERSLKPRRTTRTKRGRDGENVVLFTEELNPAGNVGLLNRVLKLQEQEARLLGLLTAPGRKRTSRRPRAAPPASPGSAVAPATPRPPRRAPPKEQAKVEAPQPAPPKLTRTVYPSPHGSMEVVTDETGRVVAISHWRRM